MERILITGASGFIGSFLVERALARGMDVWAAIRRTSSRRYLTDERIRLIELDFSSAETMTRQLDGLSFDYVVHAAGVTKSADSDAFRRVNTSGTQHLTKALASCGTPPRLLVFMSSLSIFGPVREEQPYTAISDDDEPRPNTAYGRSKLEAEGVVRRCGLPYVILRPTGVYGPRERDYYLMARSIQHHLDFAVGRKPQDLTFVYVADVVQAVFLAIERAREAQGRAYCLSDGEVYSSRTFSDLLHEALGRPWLLRLTVPLWVLHAATGIGELSAKMTGRVTALNTDKYNILKQRNWRCDITPAEHYLGYRPQYKLDAGVEQTVRWYKDNKWL